MFLLAIAWLVFIKKIILLVRLDVDLTDKKLLWLLVEDNIAVYCVRIDLVNYLVINVWALRETQCVCLLKR